MKFLGLHVNKGRDGSGGAAAVGRAGGRAGRVVGSLSLRRRACGPLKRNNAINTATTAVP